ETGLRVVSAGVYTVPYADVHVIVEVLADRQLNILEEFILRAAHELHPSPTLDGLAAMLGLDPLFVEASWRKLDAMQAVALGAGQTLNLTDRGREYYLQGQLPPASLEEELDLRYWFISDDLVPADRIPRSPAPDEILPGCNLLDEDEQMAALSRVITDVQRVISVTVAAGLELHQPDAGQAIHAVRNWQLSATGVAPVGLLIVQDSLAAAGQEDSLALRVVDLASGRRDFIVETVLQGWVDAGKVTLRDLVPVEEDPLPLSRVGEAGGTRVEPAEATAEPDPRQMPVDQEQSAEEKVAEAEQVAQSPNGDPQGEDGFPRRLMQALRDAQHTVLICSSRSNPEAGDDDLVSLLETLAARNVITVIGWGIDRTDDAQEQSPAVPLIEQLQGISTPHGNPAVIAIRAGDLDGTDVLVDGHLHMSGVDNLLSSSGAATDWVTEPQAVGQALSRVETLLAGAAAELWQDLAGELLRSGAESVPEEVLHGLARCCVIWVAVRQHQTALQHILDLVDAAPATLPVAFRLMAVTLMALQRLSDELLREQADIQLLREAVIDIDTRIG
ncbi:MAG: hypothetical protein MUQ10_02415, partial [Anaerolineae bacterium]|nr:hypothetical protein [Anaerolineae bacterium]